MSQNNRFRTTVNVRVQQLGEYPPGSGTWSPIGSQGLEISESFDLKDSGFMELAGILGRFHELAEKIQAERND